MLKWRALGLSVTAKAHLLESHAFYQMEYFHGMSDFIEEFVEQLHQFTSATSNEWNVFLILRKNATQ